MMKHTTILPRSKIWHLCRFPLIVRISISIHMQAEKREREKAIWLETDSLLQFCRHNYPALEIVRICMKELPKAKSITYFDSAFHQTIPRHIYTYPISPVVAEKNGLRKYGFHGTSYSFILRSVADFLEKPQEQTNLIVMHIGSGASICAIKHGRSLDTS